MNEATDIHKRYGNGSTEYHTAFPAQRSDGRPGGVPQGLITPPLRKPAVLATGFPEPSQGTPCTAISADRYHPGTALPRQQCGDGGAEQVSAKRWKVLVRWMKAKATQWRAQIHRYYLKRIRNHMALTTKRAFGYVRLIAFIIGVSRRALFRKTALPYGAISRFVHDCRFALFRRRAVCFCLWMFAYQIAEHPRLSQPVTD